MLLFLIPILYFTFQKEFLLESDARYHVIYFTDCVRNTGYLSTNVYEAFEKKLERTNHVYDIKLTVHHKYENSGLSHRFYLATYTDEILNQLYVKGEWYIMHQGDFFAVSVCRKDTSILQKILEKMGISYDLTFNIPFHYGGMVRDECF